MQNTILQHVAKAHPYDILQPYDVILEEHGFEALRSVVDLLGGATIHIPTMRTIFKDCIEKEATKDYLNGATLSTLVRKYGFTERQLRRMFA